MNVTEPLTPKTGTIVPPGALSATASIPPLPAIVLEPLPAAERAELLQREAIIREKLEVFIEVGIEFEAIREKRLYRETHGTFQAYCEEVWGLTDRRARQIWAASEVARRLGAEAKRNNCSEFLMPASEGQTRPLLSLPEKERYEAWLDACKTMPARGLTARHVRAVVDARLGKAGSAAATGATVAQGKPRPDRLQEKIDAAAEAIGAARRLEMKLGTADSAVTAKVKDAVQNFEAVVDHLKRIGQMQAARSA